MRRHELSERLMKRALNGIALAAFAASASAQPGPQTPPDGKWVTAWAAAMQPNPDSAESLDNQTLRMRFSPSIDAQRIRVVLTNQYGTDDLYLGETSIAPLDEQGKLLESRLVGIGGFSPNVWLRQGADAVGAAMNFEITHDSTYEVRLYAPYASALATVHYSPEAEAEVSSTGDYAGFADFPGARPISHGLLNRIDAWVAPEVSSVVVLGSSAAAVADGWVSMLEARLQAANANVALANVSLYGNALSRPTAAGGPSMLERMPRDVLLAPNVDYLIISPGSEDIGQPGGIDSLDQSLSVYRTLTAGDYQAMLNNLIARATERGIKVILTTLAPSEGARGANYHDKYKEQIRIKLNDSIRSSARENLIDIDALVRDPAQPARLLPAFNAGGGILNAAGARAIAEAIELGMFNQAP